MEYQKDELEINKKEILNLQEARNNEIPKTTSNSLADELDQVNIGERMKKKRIHALEHLKQLSD
jgi:ribosomal protein L12E/L44/L45/RPP1/RPP2